MAIFSAGKVGVGDVGRARISSDVMTLLIMLDGMTDQSVATGLAGSLAHSVHDPS